MTTTKIQYNSMNRCIISVTIVYHCHISLFGLNSCISVFFCLLRMCSTPLVEEATEESSLDGGSMALAIFILVLLLSVFLGGTYIYVRRLGYFFKSLTRIQYIHLFHYYSLI